MIELLYGEQINREPNSYTVSFSYTRVARRLRMAPQRLLETMEWLQSQGLILDQHKQGKTVRAILRAPKGMEGTTDE